MLLRCGGCEQEAEVPDTGQFGKSDLEAFIERHRPCAIAAAQRGQPAIAIVRFGPVAGQG